MKTLRGRIHPIIIRIRIRIPLGKLGDVGFEFFVGLRKEVLETCLGLLEVLFYAGVVELGEEFDVGF